MRHVKNLLILTLLFGSAGFLTNCSANISSSDTINVSLDEPYVSMGINATKDINVDANFDDVAISVENSDLVKASYFDKKIYIQVAYILADDSVVEREFGAFKSVEDNYPKYVLSMDKLDFSQNGIIHKNIIDWLMEE